MFTVRCTPRFNTHAAPIILIVEAPVMDQEKFQKEFTEVNKSFGEDRTITLVVAALRERGWDVRVTDTISVHY